MSLQQLELRCGSNKLWGVIKDGLLEVRCRFCKKKTGRITFHYFDLATGELVKTKTFKEPAQLLRGGKK